MTEQQLKEIIELETEIYPPILRASGISFKLEDIQQAILKPQEIIFQESEGKI